MSTIQGTIQTIVPTQPNPGYQHPSGGYIYTFNMTILTPAGDVTGEIGSKSQTYPLAPGQPINVTTNNTEHGLKFTKYKPQYGPPPQAPPPQTPQNRSQSPNAPQGNKPRIDPRDERISRLSCLNRAVDLFIAANGLSGDGQISFPIEAPLVSQICMLTEKFKKYVYDGLSPADQFAMNQNLPPEPTVQEGANQTFGDFEQPPPTDSDIPF